MLVILFPCFNKNMPFCIGFTRKLAKHFCLPQKNTVFLFGLISLIGGTTCVKAPWDHWEKLKA